MMSGASSLGDLRFGAPNLRQAYRLPSGAQYRFTAGGIVCRPSDSSWGAPWRHATNMSPAALLAVELKAEAILKRHLRPGMIIQLARVYPDNPHVYPALADGCPAANLLCAWMGEEQARRSWEGATHVDSPGVRDENDPI